MPCNILTAGSPYTKTKPECLIAQGHPGITMQM